MGQVWWHIPVIPATQEAEMGGLLVQSQPQQLSETLTLNKKYTHTNTHPHTHTHTHKMAREVS